jgi:hypothetical protein
MVPTAAAPQPKASCRAKGALARRAARLTSQIQSRSINEPPRANIDPLPRHPSTRGLTALEILKRDLASHLTAIVDPAAAEHQLRPATDQLGDRNSW